MPKYLSGRSKKTPNDRLPSDRYEYLSIDNAEPNPSDPKSLGIAEGGSGAVITGDTIPGGRRYQVISVWGDSNPGARYWQPVEGGLIPGALTFYEKNAQISGSSSITQMDWYGIGVTFGIQNKGSSSTDIRARIFVAPPGKVGQILFNETNENYGGSGVGRTDFSTSNDLLFDSNVGIITVGDGIHIGNSVVGLGSIFNAVAVGDTTMVGVGTTNPTQNLHVVGNVKITNDLNLEDAGTIIDYVGSEGTASNVLTKGSNGVEWIPPNQISAGAAGTVSLLQYHKEGDVLGATGDYNTGTGAIGVALVWDENNHRVGLGSTQPEKLLDVVGSARFSQLEVTGVSTFKDDVKFEGVTAGVTSAFWEKSHNRFKFNDGARLVFGTGNDLQIYHDRSLASRTDSNGDSIVNGRTGIISEFGSGGIVFLSNGSDGPGAYQFFDQDLHPLIKMHGGNNARVRLFHLGLERLLTTQAGAYVTGILTGSQTLNSPELYINPSGIGTIGNVKITSNQINSTTGNLTLDSQGGTTQVNDILYVNDTTDSTNVDTGALQVNGGVGINKNLNVGGGVSITGPADATGVAVTLASAGGITTTGGDLYIGGDLFVNDDIFLDEARVQSLIVNAGVATFHGEIHALDKVGIGTTNPTNKLHLYEDGNDSVSFKMQNHEGATTLQADGDAFHIDAGAHYFRNAAGDTNRIVIDSNGNIGVNTENASDISAIFKGIQVNNSGYIWGQSQSEYPSVFLTNNARPTSGSFVNDWKRDLTGDYTSPVQLELYNGDFTVRTAASGAANSGITWDTRFIIKEEGNVQLKGGANGHLQIDNNGEFELFEQDTSLTMTNSSKIAMDFDDNVARIRSSHNGSGGNAVSRPLAFFMGASEKVRITSDGDVGIGTTNPASGSILHLNDSSACRLQLTTDSTGQGTDDGVRLQIDTSDNFEILQREDANIEFFTHNEQRVTIDGNGKVGINTTDPQAALDVEGNIYFHDNMLVSNWNTDGASGSNIDHIWHSDDSGYGTYGTWNFASDTTAKATGNSAIQIGFLKSSGGGYLLGNVGIGTTNVEVPVTSNNEKVLAVGVVTAHSHYGNTFYGNIEGGITVTDDITIPDWITHKDNIQTKFGFPADDTFAVETNSGRRLTINSSGNVGIGTTGTTARLAIKKASGPGLDLIPATDTDDFQINFNRVGGVNRGFITYEFDNDALKFRTGGSGEALRIASDGKVGINTTNPRFDLDIVNNSDSYNNDTSLRLYNKETGASRDTIMRFEIAGTSSANYIYFGDGDDTNAGQIVYSHSIDAMRFWTNTEERLRIDSSGRVLIGLTTTKGGDNNSLLQIQGDGGTANVPLIIFDNTSASNNEILGGIEAWNAGETSTPVAAMYAKQESATDDAYLQFSTQKTGEAVTERLRITSEGHLIPGADGTQDIGSNPDSGGKRWDKIWATDIDITGDIDVTGDFNVDDLKVSGISTFVKNANFGLSNADWQNKSVNTFSFVSDSGTYDGTNRAQNINGFITGNSASGIGTGARFYVKNLSTDSVFQCTLTDGGQGYVVGDVIKIYGTQMSGVSPAGDIVMSVASIHEHSIETAKDIRIADGKKLWLNTSIDQDSSSDNNWVYADGTGGNFNIYAETIRLENTDDSLALNQLIGGLEFGKTDSSGAGTGVVGGLRMYSTTDGIASYLTLSTAEGDGSANDVERLRIDSSGNVGIGTINPTDEDALTNNQATLAVGVVTANQFYGPITGALNPTGDVEIIGKLDVIGQDANGEITVKRRDGEVDKASILTQAQVGLGRFGTNSNHNLQLMANNAGYLTITTGGAVGIGTTNPDTPLHIYANDAQQITVERSTYQNSGIRYRNTTASMFAGLTANATGFAIDDDDNLGDAPVFFVERSTGHIGINSTHPNAPLDVFKVNGTIAVFGDTRTSTHEAIKIKNNVAGYPAIVNDSSGDTLDLRSLGSVQVTIDSNDNDTTKYFRVMANDEGGAGTELFRVEEDGKFGIGTDDPQKTLNVVAGVGTTEVIRLSQPVDATVQQEFGIGWCSNNNHTWPGAQITSLEYDVSDSRRSLVFYTRGVNSDSAPTERLRIDSSGNVTPKNDAANQDLGGTGKRWNKIWAKDVDITGEIGLTGDVTIGDLYVSGISTFVKGTITTGICTISHSGEGGPYLFRDGGSGSDIVFHSSTGTLASPTASGDSNYIGNINFAPHDGTEYIRRASINAIVNGPVSSGNVPTDLLFRTGSTVRTERLRITHDGKVGIGTTNPEGILHISSGTSGDCKLIIEADKDNNEEGDNPYIIFRQDGGLEESAIWKGNHNSETNENTLNIANTIDGDGHTGGIRFLTGNTSREYANAVERMFITPAGDVGIGTTNPTATNINSALDSNTKVLAVGIVTAREYYGTFKGTIDSGGDSGGTVNQANKIKTTKKDDLNTGYLTFVDSNNDPGVYETVYTTSGITVDSSTGKLTALILDGNLAGGAANSIPYQSAADTTAFLAGGGDNTYLGINGDGDLAWGTPPGTGINAVTVTQYKNPALDTRGCSNPITVTDSYKIGIGSTSNAYGNKYVQGNDPTTSDGGSHTVCEGDIWYDTSGSGSGGGGVAGNPGGTNKQVQFNNNGSFGGAANLEFITSTTQPTLILSPSDTSTSTNGGYIQVKNAGSNGTLNYAQLSADGGLEIKRANETASGGGPYVDFRYNATDMDARIQMETASGNESDPIFSSIRFLTGGGNLHVNGGSVEERLRIGKVGEIGIDAEGSGRTSAQIYGTSGQVLTSGGSATSVYWSSLAGLDGTSKVAILEDQKTSGTAGGSFTSGAWRDRTLNTEYDPDGFVSLSDNVYFSLPAGTYKIGWSAPATAVDGHQTRLIYATDTGFTSGLGYVYGSSEQSDQNEGAGGASTIVNDTRSFGSTLRTTSVITYFKIQHRCATTSASSGENNPTWGMGKPSGFSGDSQVEVYTRVIIEDLKTAVKDSSDSGINRVAIIRDQKNADVSGGSFVKDYWRDRDLTVIEDPTGLVDFTAGGTQADPSAGNTPGYWSLPAGNYEIEWSAPGFDVNRHQTRLVWSTSESDISSEGDNNPGTTSKYSPNICEGSSENNSEGSPHTQTRSFGKKVITLNEVNYFKILHICNYSNSGGFGSEIDDISSYDAKQIYTQVKITDLKTAVKDSDGSGVSRIATVKDVKAWNVQGGIFTPFKWMVRDLNTIHDPQSIGFSVNTNIATFPAGTYKIKWRAPAYHCNRHTSRLAYSTNSTVNADNQLTTGVTYITGETSYSNADGNVFSYSEGIISSLTLTSTTYFQIQHYSESGYTHADATGLGVASMLNGTDSGVTSEIDSIYSTLEIEDLKTAVKSSPTNNSLLNTWHVQKTTNQTIDNETWTDISSLTKTVTSTSVNSKFLITATVNASMSNLSGHDGLLRLMRGTTVIGSTSTESSATADNTGFAQVSGQQSYYTIDNSSITYLDSPGAGTHTYHIEGRNTDNSSNLIVNGRTLGGYFMVSHMTIQEMG